MINLCLSSSDWIQIVNILVTISLGYWIGSTVQDSLANNRAVKDYFIEELKNIKSKYDEFLDDLKNSNLSSNQIKESLKMITLKIKKFEEFLHIEFKINSDILKYHNQFKYKITFSDEFNQSFNETKYNLNNDDLHLVYKHQKKILDLFTKTVICINKSQKSWFNKKNKNYEQKAT